MAQNNDNQILEHTFNNGPPPVQSTQDVYPSSNQIDKSIIKMELSSLNRDVNKIQAHLKSLQVVDQERKKYMSSSSNFNTTNLFRGTTQSKNFSTNNNQNENIISPYNYYGQCYRFQQRMDELRVDPPVLQERPKTEYKIEDSRKLQFDILSQNNQKLSRMADTGFEDPFHRKYPSQNYYICFQDQQEKNQAKPKLKFQQKKNHKLHNFQNRLQKNHQIGQLNALNKQIKSKNISQPKPNWFLQKKITKMQKQLKQLKRKQYQREKSNKFKGQKKKDSKININSQVESMINSLWP